MDDRELLELAAKFPALASKLTKQGYAPYYGSDFTTLRDGDEPYYISMQTGDEYTGIWFTA